MAPVYTLKPDAPSCVYGILKAPLPGLLLLEVKINLSDLVDYKNNPNRRDKEVMTFIQLRSIQFNKNEKYSALRTFKRVLNLVKIRDQHNVVLRFREQDDLKRTCSVLRNCSDKRVVHASTPMEKIILIHKVQQKNQDVEQLPSPILLETALKKYATKS